MNTGTSISQSFNSKALINHCKTLKLSQDLSDNLLGGFQDYYQGIAQLQEQAASIVVTKEDQIEEMQQAHELRMRLVRLRSKVENQRKDLKADSVLYGRAVDGLANIIKASCMPIERYLQQQEDFVKIKVHQARRELHDARYKIIAQYEPVGIENINLVEMSDQTFNEFVETSKESYELRQQKIKQEEEAEKQRQIKEAEERKKDRLKAQRIEQIMNTGLVLSRIKTIIQDSSSLGTMSEKDFNALMKQINEAKKQQNAEQAEKEKIHKELAARRDELAARGVHWSSSHLHYRNKQLDITVTETELEEYSPDDFEALIIQIDKKNKDIKERIDKRKKILQDNNITWRVDWFQYANEGDTSTTIFTPEFIEKADNKAFNERLKTVKQIIKMIDRKLEYRYDEKNDIMIIEGVKYAGDIFRMLKKTPLKEKILIERITEDDGFQIVGAGKYKN